MAELPATLRLPGVDGIYVGPRDLSYSLGCQLDPHDPVLRPAFERIWTACAEAGKPVGVHAQEGETARLYRDNGCRLVTVIADSAALARSAAASLAAARCGSGYAAARPGRRASTTAVPAAAASGIVTGSGRYCPTSAPEGEPDTLGEHQAGAGQRQRAVAQGRRGRVEQRAVDPGRPRTAEPSRPRAVPARGRGRGLAANQASGANDSSAAGTIAARCRRVRQEPGRDRRPR